MKRFSLKKYGLALVSCMVLLAQPLAVAASPITILVENDCPYACKMPTKRGFIPDILSAIFEKHGHEMRFKVVPWTRALKTFNSKSGEIDGMIGMTVHPIDKSIAIYPDVEIARYTHRFYTVKDSELVRTWQYRGTKSLEKFKVGSVKGWTYCDKAISDYLANGKAPHVQALHGEAPSERNFQKVLSGRIDLWVANINNTEYFLSTERQKGNKAAEKVVGLLDLPVTNEVNVYPIFYNNQSGKQYAAIFTQGMQELRQSGELDRIMANYSLTDWR